MNSENLHVGDTVRHRNCTTIRGTITSRRRRLPTRNGERGLVIYTVEWGDATTRTTDQHYAQQLVPCGDILEGADECGKTH